MKNLTVQKKRKLIRNAILIVVIVALIAVGVLYLLNDSVDVRCTKLTTDHYMDTFTETGHVKMGEVVNYISETEGSVVSIDVAKNTTVKKGDLIAVIDSSDLEYEKQICNAEIAALEASKSEITQQSLAEKIDIQGAIDEADYLFQEIENQKKLSSYTENMTVSPEIYINSLRVAKNQADTNVNYYSQLVSTLDKNIKDIKATVSDGDVKLLDEESAKTVAELEESLKEAQREYRNSHDEAENAKATYDDAVKRMNSGELNNDYYATIQSDFEIQEKKIKANKDALEKKLQTDITSASTQRVNKEIDAKLAQLEQLDKKIEACRIVAQYDGVVTELPIENTNRIAAGDVVAAIRTEDAFTVEVEVLTSEAPYLKEGDQVSLIQKLKSDQREYEGKISAIYDYAEESISTLGNNEYRVKVIIDLKDAAGLKDGYEVNVVFSLFEQDSVISVPNSALFKKDDKYHVFVIQNDKAKMVPVEVLHKGGTKSAISSELAAGDVIIIDANTEDLVDGSGVDAEIIP